MRNNATFGVDLDITLLSTIPRFFRIPAGSFFQRLAGAPTPAQARDMRIDAHHQKVGGMFQELDKEAPGSSPGLRIDPAAVGQVALNEDSCFGGDFRIGDPDAQFVIDVEAAGVEVRGPGIDSLINEEQLFLLRMVSALGNGIHFH